MGFYTPPAFLFVSPSLLTLTTHPFPAKIYAMSKLDKIKEELNTLRLAISILSAFLIALGGALGSMYNIENFGAMFWLAAFFMILCIFAGFLVIGKIKEKTRDIEGH